MIARNGCGGWLSLSAKVSQGFEGSVKPYERSTVVSHAISQPYSKGFVFITRNGNDRGYNSHSPFPFPPYGFHTSSPGPGRSSQMMPKWVPSLVQRFWLSGLWFRESMPG